MLDTGPPKPDADGEGVAAFEDCDDTDAGSTRQMPVPRGGRLHWSARKRRRRCGCPGPATAMAVRTPCWASRGRLTRGDRAAAPQGPGRLALPGAGDRALVLDDAVLVVEHAGEDVVSEFDPDKAFGLVVFEEGR